MIDIYQNRSQIMTNLFSILRQAAPQLLTANEIAKRLDRSSNSISQMLRPRIASGEIVTGYTWVGRGKKITTYGVPAESATTSAEITRLTALVEQLRAENLRLNKSLNERRRDRSDRVRPKKPQIPAKPGKGVPFLKETAHTDDPIKALPPPTRRAVEWLRRDGWCVWPRRGGWQVGHLTLSEQGMVDLAERRQARTAA